MPINNSKFTINDGLEERIKNICYDPLPKPSVRVLYHEPVQRLGILSPGAKFSGWQSGNGSADEQRYEVNVEIQDVNLRESRLSGYLNISNLTTEYPELTTFFEAELIGDKHSFLTHKWEADEDTDRAHWVSTIPLNACCLLFRPNLRVTIQTWKRPFMIGILSMTTVMSGIFLCAGR